jgi:hypothetical protein
MFCIEESDKTNLATCAKRVTRGPLFGAGPSPLTAIHDYA